jgi:putative sigma-54 modulation protein
MEPTIYVKNIKLTPRLETYVTKKTERLDRYMPNIIEMSIELRTHEHARAANDRQIAQLTVRDQRGTILRAEENHNDIYAAIDMVVDKMYRQIKRYRGKRHDTRRAGTPIEDLELTEEMELLPFEDDFDDEVAGTAITRHKRFPMHPMTAEEAVEQMELVGHTFYMFFNIEEEMINVVYKRREGSYGLLQPDLQ